MDECPICLGPSDNTALVITGCCHTEMHSQCYFKCMSLKPECPMCRAVQPPLDVVIPVPVPILIQNSHSNFVRHVISVVMMGISTSFIVWMFTR